MICIVRIACAVLQGIMCVLRILTVMWIVLPVITYGCYGKNRISDFLREIGGIPRKCMLIIVHMRFLNILSHVLCCIHIHATCGRIT